ncbi:MAG: hypothetical protein CVU38_02735 [Chloroflexi bacterium HGW-Chloroflexi-1]|nr:MAG: hypothetical protein CVU38_02735 [Chloroflexi bacterium HGW-Chloroflexi-1]
MTDDVAWPLALEQAGGDSQQALEMVSARPALDQAAGLTLNFGLQSFLVSGTAPRPEPVVIIMSCQETVVANATAIPIPDAAGRYFYAAYPARTCYQDSPCGCRYPLVRTGNVLQAIQAGQAVSLTIPPLTALAEQATTTVYGQTPPTARLDIYAYRFDDPAVTFQQTVTTTAAGDYQADFSGLTGFAPRDYGYVFYADAAGNHVYTRYNVPWLRTGIGYNGYDQVHGVVAPWALITVTLHATTGGDQTFWGFSDSQGAFDMYVSGPHIGDTLVVTAAGQVVSMTVPPLTVHVDQKSDVVEGHTLPNAPVRVDLYNGPFPARYENPDWLTDVPDFSISITSTSAGDYTAAFAGLADITAGNYGVVYVTDAAGYQAYQRFVLPFLQARLGPYQLRGQVSTGGPLTVTVQGPSGIIRDVRKTWSNSDGFFEDSGGESRSRLLAGDRITISPSDGPAISLTLPMLTAAADWVRGRVSGQAPPNSPLRVGLNAIGHNYPSPRPTQPPTAAPHPAGGGGYPYPSYPYNVQVTSAADGSYMADFSTLVEMWPGDEGAVFYINPDDHEVYLEFKTPAVNARIGSNYVTGVLPAGAESGTVTLRDATGQIKATASTQPQYTYPRSFQAWLYQGGGPAIIEAGDSVEVFARGTRIVVAVPELTLQSDRSTDSISGRAPPDSPLIVTWYAGDDWVWPRSRTWNITSTISGTYELDMGELVDLERSNQVEVTYTNADGNQIWTSVHVPGLQARLHDRGVTVYGAPYSPLNLSVLNAAGAPVYTTTNTIRETGSIELGAGGPDFILETGQTLAVALPGEAMTLTLPHLTAVADPLTDAVSGEAPPGARLLAGQFFWYSQGYLAITATVTGTYSANFYGTMAQGSSNSGSVIYLHPDGYRVTLAYAAPHIRVIIGQAMVGGTPPGPGPITVELRDPEGRSKGRGSSSSSYGSFAVYLRDVQQQAAPVTCGDVLVVTSAGRVVTFTVPLLTAVFDPKTAVLTGAAPPGAWLDVQLPDGQRHVQVDPEGFYAMDWSDIAPAAGAPGSVVYTDELDNQTTLTFCVPYYKRYFPLGGE